MTQLTYTRTLSLTIVQCCACAIEYGIPESLDQTLHAQKTRASTYCPNGHQWHYTGLSDAEKLHAAQIKLSATEDQLEAAKRDAASKAREIRAIKRRAAAGVCPCCKRTFVQLQRHMNAKHPEYGARTKDGTEQ